MCLFDKVASHITEGRRRMVEFLGNDGSGFAELVAEKKSQLTIPLKVTGAVVGRELELIVRNEGVGFDSATGGPQAGIGLDRMVERTRLVDGQLSVTSAPGQLAAIYNQPHEQSGMRVWFARNPGEPTHGFSGGAVKFFCGQGI